MGSIIVMIGGLICLVGAIMVLIEAFKTSIVWGLIALFGCGIGFFVFVAMHWSQSKKGFLIWLLGFGIELVGMVLGGGAAYLHR